MTQCGQSDYTPPDYINLFWVYKTRIYYSQNSLLGGVHSFCVYVWDNFSLSSLLLFGFRTNNKGDDVVYSLVTSSRVNSHTHAKY